MTVRVSTDMVDSRSQLQFWREVVCDTFVPFAFEPRRGQSARFHGEVISEDLGVARLTTVISEPHGLSRPAELVRRSGQDDLLVDVVVRGRVTVRQDERTAVLRPGDLTVYDSARPSAISCPTPFEMVVLQIPREEFALHCLARPETAATATAIRGDSGVGLLVSSFLRSLAGQAAQLPRHSARRIGVSALELLGASLPTLTDNAVRPSEIQAAHLARARQYMLERLGDPRLTPATVAQALGMSVRYLHALFHAEGTSPARWTTAQRLERASRQLSSPGQRGRTITEIAFGLGFKDGSHFTRTFKGRYGVSPREYRARMLS